MTTRTFVINISGALQIRITPWMIPIVNLLYSLRRQHGRIAQGLFKNGVILAGMYIGDIENNQTLDQSQKSSMCSMKNNVYLIRADG